MVAFSAAFRFLPHLKVTPPLLFPLLPAEHLSGRYPEKLGLSELFVQGANLRFAGKDVFLKSHASTTYTAQKS